ncbi:MAG: glycosyltransferase family 4 protein [Ilumatobacteraceae bacterium]
MTPTGGGRVAYVGFVTGDGGDALQMLTLAHGVQGSGWEVEVHVPDTPENARFAQRCGALGVWAATTGSIVITGPGSRQRLRPLVRFVRTLDADVVHVHAGDVCLPRTMMLALLLTRRRAVVATLQSPYPFFGPRSGRARFWALTARRALCAVVSPSDHGTRFQRACGIPARLAVTIRNSIDHLAFASRDPAHPRAVLGVDAGTPVVLFSSRLDAQKRPVDAVRAFALAAPDPSPAVLAFVGSGDEEAAIVGEARRLGVDDRLRMVGYQLDVAAWLAASTAWIFPTERENFSVALLEAMAAGCAVVATMCPGNDEVLVDGANALTFPIGDVGRAAQLLRQVLADAALRRRLGESAARTASNHSAGRMVEQYVELYTAVRERR